MLRATSYKDPKIYFHMSHKLLVVFLVLVCQSLVFSQSIEGRVIDENGAPVPFAHVFVKNNNEARAVTNNQGEYTIFLDPGPYDLIVRVVGYETIEQFITVKVGQRNIYNFQLVPSTKEMNEVEIKVKRRNIAHQIIMKVAERKDTINPDKHNYTAQGYIRASEKRLNTQKKSEAEIEEELKLIADPYEREEKKKEYQLKNNASINLMEIDFERHYQAPNLVKEIRNGVQIKGNTRDLYYLTTVKSNFNFFNNFLYVTDLNESAVTSPISWAGIASYKYKLVEQFFENGHKFHKIEIAARNSAQSTLSGHIVVQDSVWMVRSMSFRMEKGNLKKFDYFEIDQTFDNWGDTLCVLVNQEMRYGVKYKGESSEGKTVLTYSNFNFDVNFPKRFFSNEVATTTKEAYEKDSAYWKESRKVDFTQEEEFLINKRDSIEAFYNRKEYLDSIDAEFNRIDIWKILWFGIEHRNRELKTQWMMSSVAMTFEPVQIAGPRISPKFFYFKKWKDERFIDTYTNISIGLINRDPKGSANLRYLYNPFKNAYLYGNFSHAFGLIRYQDAISQIFLRDNFMEITRGMIGHSFELFNGFFVGTELEYNQRRSVRDYKFVTALDSLVSNQETLEFEPYNSLLVNVSLSYTPGQKFMREPYRKLILGSKFPTFYVNFEKGVKSLFGSEVDHNYISFGVRQTLRAGTLGSTRYNAKAGQFFNSSIIREPDMKYHRRSDLFWFSSPMWSFQGLRDNYATTKMYYEFHVEHNFYSGLINKIPFMKKTRINTLAGGGMLFVPEYNLNYHELFAGIYRDFKFMRRRLRVGIYGVYANDNFNEPFIRPKFSFAIFDDRELRFNF
jgi:hypothetical protein